MASTCRLAIIPFMFFCLATAQTRTVCTNGLCFETVFLEMRNTNITLGFAMPRDNCDEFLVNATIPLPYGFLSFTPGNNAYYPDSCPKEVALFIDLAVIPGPEFPPLNLSDTRAQLSTQQGDKLVPFGDVESTPSVLTNRTADQIHMIARMKGSQLRGLPFLTDEVALMTATFSMNAPEYVDPQNQKAELYLNGSTPVGFRFNAASARFDNYTEMLKVAGFNS